MRVEFTALRSRIACSTIWASQALPHAPDFVLQAVEGGNRPRSDGWSGNWRAQDRSWECSWEVQASHSEKRVLPAVSIGKELAFRLVHLWDSWGLDRERFGLFCKQAPAPRKHSRRRVTSEEGHYSGCRPLFHLGIWSLNAVPPSRGVSWRHSHEWN